MLAEHSSRGTLNIDKTSGDKGSTTSQDSNVDYLTSPVEQDGLSVSGVHAGMLNVFSTV